MSNTFRIDRTRLFGRDELLILARQFALFFFALSTPNEAQTVQPRLDAGGIIASLNTAKFLEGKTLERLKNGQSVAFDFQLQLQDGQKTLTRSIERFILSYDLWQEDFSAVQVAQASPRVPIFSTARLKSDAVANWCLGRMKLTFSKADRKRPLVLQLEIRTAGLKLPNPLRPQGSVDLAVLVDIFSRPPDPKEARFTAQSSTFTLESLGVNE